MKKRGYIVVGFITLIVLALFLINFQMKNTTIDKSVKGTFFGESGVKVQQMNKGEMIPLDITAEKEREVIALLQSLELKKTKESYGPLEADYLFIAKANSANKLYLFIEDDVVVISTTSSTGLRIQNKELVEEMIALLS